MAQRDLTPLERGVKARRPDYTKSFEAAIGAALDAMPSGAKKAFAARMGRSPQWVSRLVDPFDHIRLGASEVAKALHALGEVGPLESELRGVRIAGVEYELTPRSKAKRSVAVQLDSLRLTQSVGAYLEHLADGLEDGRLSDTERAGLRGLLRDHRARVDELIAALGDE